MKITEKVKSYEDVCKIKGIDPVKSLPFPEATTDEEKAINGFTRITRTIEVLNEGWKPDWNNWDERKYYPWFDLKTNEGAGSGVGFSFNGYYFDHSLSSVGSRLVLKSRELVEHIVKYFLEDYKAFMTFEG